jgi:large subunit ribosomal protein L23
MATAKTEVKMKQKELRAEAKAAAKNVKKNEKPAKTVTKKTEMANGKSHGKESDTESMINIIKKPVATEKCIRQIEFDNRLVFVVDKKASKQEIKEAVEKMFKVKVIKVNVQNSIKGEKKAYVKLSPANPASDVSADLGLI